MGESRNLLVVVHADQILTVKGRWYVFDRRCLCLKNRGKRLVHKDEFSGCPGGSWSIALGPLRGSWPIVLGPSWSS